MVQGRVQGVHLGLWQEDFQTIIWVWLEKNGKPQVLATHVSTYRSGNPFWKFPGLLSHDHPRCLASLDLLRAAGCRRFFSPEVPWRKYRPERTYSPSFGPCGVRKPGSCVEVCALSFNCWRLGSSVPPVRLPRDLVRFPAL